MFPTTEMRILVTRPQPDADHTAGLLRARGHDAIICPLMEIVPNVDAQTLNTKDLQAVLITSANGARALAAVSADRDLRILAVGVASAEAARNEGFRRVESADGDVDTLAALVQQTLDPKDGKLLHVAGSVTAGDLSGFLAQQGFEIEKVALYHANTADLLPRLIETGLKSQNFDAIVLFSPRTARIFASLVDQAGLRDSLRNISAFCLSPAVAETLRSTEFRDVQVSYRPDHQGILDLVDTHP